MKIMNKGVTKRVLVFAVLGVALCEHNSRIYNAHELVRFSNNVNSGTSYEGTTVFLESDIDFTEELSEQFEPIGKVISYEYFAGTFDGQGHTISNLVINSSSHASVGLFGYSGGTTVRNVILDSTCSMVSSCSRTYPSVIGPIIGTCYAKFSPCRSENNINMADITFLTNNNLSTYIVGGIHGWFISSTSDTTYISNCANYGSIQVTESYMEASIGGIVGTITGIIETLKIYASVKSVFSAGFIKSYGDLTKKLFVGGIAGRGYCVILEQCVFDNKITVSVWSDNIVGIVGDYKSIKISNCYWKSSTNYGPFKNSKKKPGCISFNDAYELAMPVSIGSYTGKSLLDALNAFSDKYYIYNNCSQWVFNEYNNSISFTMKRIGPTKSFMLTRHLVMLQHFATGGELTWFRGWYTDMSCTEQLADFIVVGDTELYGELVDHKYMYTITFDTRSDIPSPSPITSYVNSLAMLPNITKNRSGCLFLGWVDKNEEFVPWRYYIQPRNITLYASWLCNHITTPNEFFEFSRSINNEAIKTDATVVIDSDIDFDGFNGSFEPIGHYNEDDDYFFKGTFDGQGHVIRNLRVASDKNYVGIFGFSSYGFTIQNVVVDSSCEFYGTAISTKSTIGGIVGYCVSGSTTCAVKNSINMATVSFYGSLREDLYLGGIMGYCNYNCLIKNCANYGSIAYVDGECNEAYLGGIVGQLRGTSKTTVSILSNNINYGNVVRLSGDIECLYIGGIVGYSRNCQQIENCVNFGVLNNTKISNLIGFIAGFLYSSVVSSCYWSDARLRGPIGEMIESIIDNSALIFDNFKLDENISIGNYEGDSLIDALNAYTELDSNYSYSGWLINEDEYNVSFEINGLISSSITLNSPIIICPNLAEREKMQFFGWFNDCNCTKRSNGSAITDDSYLYGKLVEKPEVRRDNSALYITQIAFVAMLGTFILVVAAYFIGRNLREAIMKNNEIKELIEPLFFDEQINILEEIRELYPLDYKRPSIRRALITAGIDADRASEVSIACYRRAERLQEIGKLHDNISIDDAAAVILYTMEINELVQNPYRMINNALMDGTLDALEPVKDLMYVVMCSLRKLPIVHGKTLYRGIRTCVKLNKPTDKNIISIQKPLSRFSGDVSGNYKYSTNNGMFNEFDKIVWHAISSTSPDVAVTKAFLARCSTSGNAEGTLFIIENGWGYNIQTYSMFPEEEEIVLEPERHFQVKSVIPGEGLTIVKLKMLRTPLVLPEVFGKKKFSLF